MCITSGWCILQIRNTIKSFENLRTSFTNINSATLYFLETFTDPLVLYLEFIPVVLAAGSLEDNRSFDQVVELLPTSAENLAALVVHRPGIQNPYHITTPSP